MGLAGSSADGWRLLFDGRLVAPQKVNRRQKQDDGERDGRQLDAARPDGLRAEGWVFPAPRFHPLNSSSSSSGGRSALSSVFRNMRKVLVMKSGSRCSAGSRNASRKSSMFSRPYSSKAASASRRWKASRWVASKQQSTSSKSRSSNSSLNSSSIRLSSSQCTRSSLTQRTMATNEETR